MKKILIRIATAILCLCMLLSACAKNDTDPEAENGSADSGYLTLYSDGKAYFDVIKEEGLSEGYLRTEKMGEFYNSVLTTLGEKVGSETAPGFTDKVSEDTERIEIHYGLTACDESKEILSAATLDAYGYRAVENRIFIYGHTLSELEKAGDEFIKFMRKNMERDEDNNKIYKIPVDAEAVFNQNLAILEAPRPDFGDSALFCDDGDDGRLWVVSGCDADDFGAYRAELEKKAFELYDDNEIDGNLFATYRKGDIILDVWYTKDGYVRVTATRGFEPLPKDELKAGVDYEKICEPGVAMVGGVTDPDARSEMLFFKLSDGRFVVVDGGLKTGETMAKLFKAMQDKSEDPEKIVVACWLFTHTHGDHVGAIQELASNLNAYKGKLVIESFMYNFSDQEQAMVPAQTVTMNDTLRGYFKKFPDAKRYKAHPGNVAYFADMKIEILSTFENYIYTSFPNNNNAVNTMFKITLGGEVILIPGDTGNYDQDTLVKIYSDALKCDILQAVHHGFRGGTPAMYRLCLPKVVLFCCCKDDAYYGIQNWIGYDYNQALVDKTQNPNFEEYFVAGTSVTYLPLPYVKGTETVT